MKKQLFLILVLYVTSVQVAVAGAKQGEQAVEAGLDAIDKSWSPQDNDSPAVIMRQLDDGYTELTTVEKRTSSGSTPFEEVKSTTKTCMSAKCNPSKASEKDSGDNKKGTGTNGKGLDANDQAVQQINQ